MAKVVISFIVLCCLTFQLNAQQAVVEQSNLTDRYLQKALAKAAEGERFRVLVRKKPGVKISEVRKLGLSVNSHFGQMITLDLPIEDVPEVAKCGLFESLYYGPKENALLDSVKYHTNTWAVHKGWGPYGKQFKGKGVIVGIVDSGIDFDHAEFMEKGEEDKTRILYIWNQWDKDGAQPDSFSYGSEYSKSDIEKELKGETTGAIPRSDFDPTYRGALGHGTHVSGTAAGLEGIAPEANIIAVSVTWESAAILDAIKYIFDKSIELDMPCVINLSIGTQFDIHDGTGDRAEAYNALLSRKPKGSAVVAAAGNSGNDLIHWGAFDLKKEEQFAYFYGNPIELACAIPDSLIDSIEFAVTAFKVDYDPSKDSFREQRVMASTPWFSVRECLQDSYRFEFKNSGKSEASLTAFTDAKYKGSDQHFFQLYIDDISEIDLRENPPVVENMELFAVRVRGKGEFHSWLQYVSTYFTGRFVSTPQKPEEHGLSSSENYRPTNDSYSITAPGVYKGTICVGAFVNKWGFYDTEGRLRPPRWGRKPNGSLTAFSGRGPSVDGRILPEICAPGQNVHAAIPDYYNGFSDFVGDGTFANKTGTSMASPVVSGAVALMLEQDSSLSMDSIRARIIRHAFEDEHTESHGSLPNNYWGHGKLDVYKTMSDGIYFSEEDPQISYPQIFPNPSNGQLYFNEAVKDIELYDLQGRKILDVKLELRSIRLPEMAEGMYLIRFRYNDQLYRRQLLIKP